MRFQYLAILGLLPALGCDSPIEGSATCTPLAYSIGSSVSGSIANGDCELGPGNVGDVYQVTLTGQTNFLLTLTPTGFSGNLMMQAGGFSGSGAKPLIFEVVGTTLLGAKAFLPAGTYTIIVTPAGNTGGGYRLESVPTELAGCSQYFTWTYPGADITGNITANDCGANGDGRQDVYGLWMNTGQSIAVSGSLDKAGAVLLRTGSGQSADLITRILSVAGSAAFNFTAPRTDEFRVHMLGTPLTAGQTNYTLSIR